LPKLESENGTLRYTDEGEGRPVLFLHSLAGESSMWDEVRARLATRCRVVTLDARGHGGSEARGAISVAQFAEDAARLLDTLELRDVLAVGLSMGGQAVMMLERLRPGRVSGLVLADTSLGSGSDGTERRRSVSSRLSEIGLKAFTDEYVRSRTNRPDSPGARNFADHMARMSPEVYVEQSVSISMLDLRDLAGQIAAPTLVLVGEDDASTPPEAARRLAAAIPGASCEVIADANHLSVLDQPAAFAQAVTQRLERYDAKERTD